MNEVKRLSAPKRFGWRSVDVLVDGMLISAIIPVTPSRAPANVATEVVDVRVADVLQEVEDDQGLSGQKARLTERSLFHPRARVLLEACQCGEVWEGGRGTGRLLPPAPSATGSSSVEAWTCGIGAVDGDESGGNPPVPAIT